MSGTLLDNLGCKRVREDAWCDVQPLGGGPRGYVAARYLRPAVAPHGAVVSGPDDSALRAGQGQFDAAEFHYRAALQLKPEFSEAWYNLGVLRAKQGRPAEAKKRVSNAS